MKSNIIDLSRQFEFLWHSYMPDAYPITIYFTVTDIAIWVLGSPFSWYCFHPCLDTCISLQSPISPNQHIFGRWSFIFVLLSHSSFCPRGPPPRYCFRRKCGSSAGHERTKTISDRTARCLTLGREALIIITNSFGELSCRKAQVS